MSSNCTIVNRTMLSGERLEFDVDVGQRAVTTWSPNASISANTLIAPTKRNRTGFVYSTVADGQTGTIEPAWGPSTKDGSLTWTQMTPPAVGEDSIASVTWTQQDPPDSALTITGQTNTNLVASAYLGGGTSGNVYLILVAVTMISTAVHEVQIVLTVL